MKCIYCKKDVRLDVWGKHSQECEDRKRVRSSVPTPLNQDIDLVFYETEDTETFENHEDTTVFLNNLSRSELIEYLEVNEIEHDPKAKKSKLLKLAKGE